MTGHSSCSLVISFSPTAVGQRSGSLRIAGSSGGATASLSGVGEAVRHTLSLVSSAAQVRDGAQVMISGVLDGKPSTGLAWSVQDPAGVSGSIDSTGLYTAPRTTPAAATVSIVGTYQQDPSVTASLSLPIWDALPVLTSVSASPLVVGTQTVFLSGTGLQKVSSVLLNGVSTAFQLMPDATLSIQPKVSLWDSGNVSMVAEVSGVTGGDSNALTVPIEARAATYDAAVRLTEQASFGATPARVESIQQLGIPAWIDRQLTNPRFAYTDPAYRFSVGQWYRNTQNDTFSLRQRVALALQQQFVVSTKGNLCFEPKQCGPLWEDMMERDAFGNVRVLLQDVAQSMLMGAYLDNAQNEAYANGPPPNQNMGRELMQVMTIGTVQLQSNGQPVLDPEGNTIPAYTQANVVGMAAALSGWDGQESFFPDLYGPLPAYTSVVPMLPNPSGHDQGAKNILPGVTIPAGQGGIADLNSALDALFQHPNLAPFLCKRLIQNLVESNPSPAYVARMSAVFANDGQGTRGNLGAVVKAILLDPEARLGDDPTQANPTGGHLAEPILYLSAIVNAVNGSFTDEEVQGIDAQMGQGIYQAPSIFGYYSPAHQLADGTPAPEAQLFDNVYVFNKMSTTYEIFHNTLGGFWVDWSTTPFWNCASEADLLDLIDHLLYHGTLSAQNRAVLAGYLDAQPKAKLNDLLPDVLFLAVTNTAYQTYR